MREAEGNHQQQHATDTIIVEYTIINNDDK